VSILMTENTERDAPTADKRMVKFGLLMEAAVTYQQSAEESLNRLKAHTQGLDTIVREEIRRTMVEELVELSAECRRATRALEALKGAANLRFACLSIGITAVCTGLALAVLWYVLPRPSQIAALRAERDRYAANIAQLERRGARIELRRCGEGDARLCVHVDTQTPALGSKRDYFIVKGY